jgi:hypothetical protein
MVAHFEGLTLSSNNAIVFNDGSYPYTVRSLYQTNEGEPILSISTRDEWPRTPLGVQGYFYTPTGELSFNDDRYNVEQLDNNIFCYKRE